MPPYERRLHEPSNDARTFDGGDDDFQEDEGSRLPLLIVIALVVLASFAGVVWIAYTQGVQRGREDAPRVASAGEGKGSGTKEQSDPYAKLDIYNAPRRGAGQSQGSPAVPEKPAPSASATSSGPAAAGAKSPAGATVSAQTRLPSVAESATPPAAKPQPEAKAAPNRATAPDQSHAVTSVPRPIIPPAARPASAPANTGPRGGQAAVRPLAQQASVVAQGAYVLQIGSYPSEAEARASWETYKHAHSSVSGYGPDVKSADLGKRGVWYRLRIGPFANLADANAACAKLKAQGGSCFPTKQ